MLWGAVYLLFAVSSSVWSVGSQPTEPEDDVLVPSPAAVAVDKRFSLLQEARAFNSGGGRLDLFAWKLSRAKEAG